MNQRAVPIDHKLEAERRLLEAAAAEVRADPRPSVPHTIDKPRTTPELPSIR